MVGLIDTTLRDGAQTLWSSRLPIGDIVPIARSMDKAGYEAIDLMAPVTFEVCVKHLKENPWQRVRIIRSIITNTPLITHVRSRSLTSFDLVADDVIHLMIQRCAANGFRRIMIMDALNDLDNLRFGIEASKQVGLHVAAVLFYTISPIHTNEYYANKAAQLAKLGADSVCIRDASGLLTPERARELIPIIRRSVGALHLQLKSHCTTGLAEACYVEAIKHGVNSVFTATTPLANGPSVPAVESIVARLQQLGEAPPVDAKRLEDIADYFAELAERTGKPVGRPVEKIDQDQYEHQVPGGMISFLKDQLRSMHLEHRLPKVLEEFPRVRADLGYPVVVSPVSQLIGVQAVLNVVNGERYKNIPIEVQKYVLGYYGRPEAPINRELLDRVAERNKGEMPPRDNDILQRIREQFGPFDSDDDLLLHVLFRPDQLKDILPPRGRTAPAGSMPKLENDFVGYLKEIQKLRRFSHIYVRTNEYSLKISQTPRRLPGEQ